MVLLTGGGGYIGSHVALELLSIGEQIIVLDSFENSDPNLLISLKDFTGKDFEIVVGDYGDECLLEELFASHCIDSVIHLAGYKSVAESIEFPSRYYQNNFVKTLGLFSVMEKFGCRRLVFSSTATLYGNVNDVPVDETASASPLNPYGRSKLMVEMLMEDLASASEWSFISLRYFNPIGASRIGIIGELANNESSNLMSILLQVAAGDRGFLEVFGVDYPTNDGSAIRDYIHVQDLARGHISALDFIRSKTGYEHVNLGTGCGFTVFELVKAVESASGKPITTVECARRKGDIAISIADVQKARNLLNWEAKLSINEMALDSWNWYLKSRARLAFSRDY